MRISIRKQVSYRGYRRSLSIVRYNLIALLIPILLMGCASQKPYQWTGFTYHYIKVDSTIHKDSSITRWLAPFHAAMVDSLGKTIGYSTGNFKINQPEGTLGDMVADAIRDQAAMKLGRYVDMGVFSNSNLRFYLPKGPVTALEIANIMPYDSQIVLLKITGSQLVNLAREIADLGGEPVSGLRMNIENGQPHDMIVGSRLIAKDSTYLVATTDLIADGGDHYQALLHPIERLDLGLSVRQAVMNYVDNRMKIRPMLDGRMRSADE